jgi:hypothetical protein
VLPDKPVPAPYANHVDISGVPVRGAGCPLLYRIGSEPAQNKSSYSRGGTGKNPGYFETVAGSNRTTALDAGKAACLMKEALRVKA